MSIPLTDPDKVAFATLYFLYANEEANVGDCAEQESIIAERLRESVTLGQVRSQLEKLKRFELVSSSGGLIGYITGGSADHRLEMPVHWQITDRGAKFVHRCLAQRKGFIARLHQFGLPWIATPDARNTKLSASLSKPEIDEMLASPISSGNAEINWTKWGAISALTAIPTMVLLWWFTK